LSYRRLGLLFVLVLIAPFLIDVLITTDEERVEGVIEQCVAALQERSVPGVMECVSEDFVGSEASLGTKELAADRLERVLGPVDELRIETDIAELIVEEGRASLHLQGILLVRFREGASPARFRVSLALRPDAEGRWKIHGSSAFQVSLGL
jgi:ketosteroid isomerase-like protein